MPKQPNIVFFHCDSMDGRLVGPQGHPALRDATPNLDALAQRGTTFPIAYCNSPICVCSRASMVSGQYIHHCEAWNNYKGLDEDDPNVFTHLDTHGWRTQLSPRTDYLSGHHTIRARVTAWTRSANIERPGYGVHPMELIDSDEPHVHEGDWDNVAQQLGWLRQHAHDDDTPFFLYVAVSAPHPGFRTSRHYLEMIDQSAIDIPLPDDEEHPVIRYMRISRNWRLGFGEEIVRRTRGIYFAMCAEVDAMFGQVARALDEMGLTDSTYVIFSSDHGELALEHQLWYKMSMYEGAVRIPLMVAGPGVRQGAVIERPTSLVDLYPTLVDMARLPQPPGLDGHSLMAELTGQPIARPDSAFAEYHDTACNTGTFMLRRGDWKYVAYVGYEPQLFNLRDDAAEVHNLAKKQPQVVQDMDTRMRHIVDYTAVDGKVKTYDRHCFRRWRQEQRSAGTYEQSMARIYSGWDNITEADIEPWTAEDEAKIVAWMNRE